MLFCLVVVVLLYVTTVPFGVEIPPNFGKKWERTEILPFYLRQGERYHPSDLLGNFLLFLPFGFALQGWRLERRREQAAGLWPTIGSGMLMSLAIETMQFLLRDRYTSINDWILNVAGTAAGAWIARNYYAAQLERGIRLGRRLLQRPAVLVLLLLLFIHALWMLSPFNFTLATHNFVRKWQHWKFSVNYLASLPLEMLTLDRREYWPLVLLENLLFGSILGGQFVLCQRWYRPGDRRFFRIGIALLGLALCLIAFLQFIVIGSNPDALPLLAVTSGLMLGLILMKKWVARRLLMMDGVTQLSPRTEALLLVPGFLLFALLLLRPDLPDLRVAQMQDAQHLSAQQSIQAFFTQLCTSVRPSFLSLGGSAYFRLFLKLLFVTIPLAFALATIKPRRQGAPYPLGVLHMLLLCTALGLAAQALRFCFWGSSVNLLAVFALALGGGAGVWMETWWEKYDSNLQPSNLTTASSP